MDKLSIPIPTVTTVDDTIDASLKEEMKKIISDIILNNFYFLARGSKSKRILRAQYFLYFLAGFP